MPRILDLAGLFAAVLFLLAPNAAYPQSSEQKLDETTYIEIAERILPAVVNIRVEPREQAQGHAGVEDYYQFFREEQFPGDPESGALVSGSGVLIDRMDGRGFLLTNNHVVALAGDDYQLRLMFHELDESGTEYTKKTEIAGETVRIIGRDELSDLAVIEFDFPSSLDISPVGFADSDQTKIGEHVLALGSPLDLSSTVTPGIISAKARYLGTQISLAKLLQTNASIQPGSSGGPLVNLDGNIIGINNAIASRNGLWTGIGFAIPSNDAKRISRELIDNGRVMRGFLGIEMHDVRWRSDLARDVYKLDDFNGVFVMKVIPDSPAENAGLVAGDVVRKIDGYPVRDSDEMLRIIANKIVNDEVELEMVRLDDAMAPGKVTAVATLTERPESSLLREMKGQNHSTKDLLIKDPETSREEPFFGLRLQVYSPGVGTESNGLRVTSILEDSAGGAAGLQLGDVITIVNGRAVESFEDLETALEDPMGAKHIIRYQREGKSMTVMIDASPAAAPTPRRGNIFDFNGQQD